MQVINGDPITLIVKDITVARAKLAEFIGEFEYDYTINEYTNNAGQQILEAVSDDIIELRLVVKKG
jgi:hypothetical protein